MKIAHKKNQSSFDVTCKTKLVLVLKEKGSAKLAVTTAEISQVQILYIFSPRKSKVKLQYIADCNFRKYRKLLSKFYLSTN